jgi:hypothetical protein
MSADGASWSYAKAGPNRHLYSVAWNGSRYVAVGGALSGGILVSSDGATWSRRDRESWEPLLYDVAWNGNEFLAVGAEGRVLASADGESWDEGSAGTSLDLHSLAWTGALWQAVGEDGFAAESADGRRWSPRASGSASDLYGVVWAGERLLGLGRGGAILDGGCSAEPQRAPRAVERD